MKNIFYLRKENYYNSLYDYEFDEYNELKIKKIKHYRNSKQFFNELINEIDNEIDNELLEEIEGNETNQKIEE